MTTTLLAYIPSPDQGVWHLGAFPLRAYALCILAGIVAALILGDRRWTARGGEPGVIYDIALYAVPFGLIGGRLYHVLTDWTTYFGPTGRGFGAALRIWDGGLGIWGAVALGGVGAWIGCRKKGIPLPAFGDAIAPGILLAQAIGRLGNYFNQELYGRPTTVPWGLEVYERRNAAGVPDSLNGVSTGRLVEVVHPTFLYELLWNLAIVALLLVIDRRFKIGHGRLFALYVAGYCLGRFWIELMRSDYATTIADTGIRVNTFTSTFVFIAAVVYVMVATKGREAPETLRGNAYSPLENVAEGVTAAAATTGVVAAAVVASREDERDQSADDVADANVDDTGDTRTAIVVPDDIPADADAGASEAKNEAEDLAEQVETASSEDIAEAVAFAEAGDEADAEAGAARPEDGLGSVDGDEVDAARDDAVEVHEAAAEGARDADAIADDVAGEPAEVVGVDGDVAIVVPDDIPADADPGASEAKNEAEDLAEQVETASSEDIAEAVAFAEAGDEADAEAGAARPEDGLGSVDGDEVVAAQDDAVEVHEAAAESAQDAEAIAGDVAGEADSTEAAPEDGLGSVEGDEVVAAEGDAAEVHAAAVEGAADADALADDARDEPAPVAVEGTEVAEALNAEPEPESELESNEAAPEDGLGSVDGDEVVAAEGDAAEVHAAAAEGADDADALADDVAAESETTEPEPEPESEVESTEAAPEDGLGSVDGDEVVAAEGDAAEVHAAAAEGADDADALADDVAAESETPDATPTTPPSTTTFVPPPRRRFWQRTRR